jgi:branched-chain amino acid transport system permease protein
MSHRGRAIAVLAVAALAPLLFDPGGVVLNNMVLATAYVVMALGLNIVVGFAGLLDLGYVAFFAIGAYTAAYVASSYRGIHLDFLLVLALAVVTCGVAGATIGIPTLRLRGDHIAMVTLAFGEIISQVAGNGASIPFLGGTLTPGPIGITPIDRIDLPLVGRLGVFDLRPWYWVGLALVALVVIVNVHLRDSRIGRAWMAMRDDEVAACCAGVPIVRTKLLAYGTGAAFGGISGAFLASYLSDVNASQFEFSFSIFIFAMVVLGGLGSVWGVIAGAVILSAVNNYLLPDVLYDLPSRFGLDFDLSQVASGIYGFILVAVVLLRPQGLIPARRRPDPRAVQPARPRGRLGLRRAVRDQPGGAT